MRRPPRVDRPLRPTPSPLWRHERPAHVALSPDGRVLVSAAEALRCADLELGQPTHSLALPTPSAGLAVTAAVAAVITGREVWLVNLHAGRRTAEVRLKAPGVAVAVSHDGSWVAAVDAAGSVTVARTATGRRVARWVELSAVGVSASWTPPSLWLVHDDGRVTRGDLTGVRAEVAPAGPRVDRVVPTLDRAHAVAGGRAVGLSGTVAPWHGRAVSTLDALVDERLVVGGGAEGWWAVGEGTEARGSEAVHDVAAHPGGAHVALSEVTGEVGFRPVRDPGWGIPGP